jgi:hypothetical protein
MKNSEDVSAPLPLSVQTETIAWLRERLLPGPQRIASLLAEWCGGQRAQTKGGAVWESGRDGTNGRWISELMSARVVLGVVACIDDDSIYCWRLPQGGKKGAEVNKNGQNN